MNNCRFVCDTLRIRYLNQTFQKSHKSIFIKIKILGFRIRKDRCTISFKNYINQAFFC